MEIQGINELAGTAPSPVAARQPDKIVTSVAKSQTDPGQGDAMTPGSDRSQAGLIAEALVSGSAGDSESTDETTREAQRVLKPWGVAMLPDETRTETQSDEANQAETKPDEERASEPRSADEA